MVISLCQRITLRPSGDNALGLLLGQHEYEEMYQKFYQQFNWKMNYVVLFIISRLDMQVLSMICSP